MYIVFKKVISYFQVLCKGKFFNRQMVFNHLYAQIVPKINAQVDYTELNKNTMCAKPLNIILLSYDSLSRVSWFKRLPKTTNYIIKEMQFNILHGQSILGDGTPACMIPLLTGKTEEELPSALKSDPDGKYVGMYRQIFRQICRVIVDKSFNML